MSHSLKNNFYSAIDNDSVVIVEDDTTIDEVIVDDSFNQDDPLLLKKGVVVVGKKDDSVEKNYPLNSKWTLYLHNTQDDWSQKSYKKILVIYTVEDFWRLLNNFPDFTLGSYYLMKEDILPIWEDPSNKNGCRWSYSINFNRNRKYDRVYKVFEEVCMYAVGCTVFENVELINGIEVQIKQKYNKGLIKIWFTEDFPNKSPINNKIIPHINNRDTLYLKN